ncbi:uncharacterized protein LOC105644482 [Jatropha curcas]|uniref:uncharacterized protein LOC105644482 n=1 Tax=Jatropha curcas TaxID=180498 RepID=UPI001893F51F|nr:uncharacterized protein LOC105644482 [Jatropha curcas]
MWTEISGLIFEYLKTWKQHTLLCFQVKKHRELIALFSSSSERCYLKSSLKIQSHAFSSVTDTSLYPRVKVRKHEGEEDGDLEYLSPPKGNSDLLFLEITESPYVQEKENQSDTLDLIARITKPYVPNLTPQPNPISASKVKKKKPHSVSRPRAVLSSPANDLKVGNGNRMKISKERSLGLRKCNSEPKKKQTQNKPTASASHAIAAESSLYLRKGDLKAATASNIIAKSEGLSSKVKG